MLSSPPEWVSGGDARVEVVVPREVPLGGVTVAAGGTDVTEVFSADEGRHRLEGVVRELPLRQTRIVAWSEQMHASLIVINHPRSGPMFSGKQQEPFVCTPPEERAAASLADVDLRAHCGIDPQVDFVYLSSETDTFRPFDPQAPPPDDLAQTTMGDETVDVESAAHLPISGGRGHRALPGRPQP